MQTFDDFLLNLGHRGASADAPENTLAAFKTALQWGAAGIELDVQFSSDHQVVVIHDETLDRTTDGKGQVNRRSLAHLKALDAGLWFSAEFAGVRLPTLAETLAFADGKLLLDIEIKKCRDSKELARDVVGLLNPYNPDQYLITSFDKTAIEQVKAMQPGLRTGLLANRRRRGIWQGSWDFIILHDALVEKRLLRLANESGKRIIAWTVNDEKRMKDLIEQGVGRMITNHPNRLQKVFNDYRNGLTKS
jgi:glycerophosphoryl diester phosphodiesterase